MVRTKLFYTKLTAAYVLCFSLLDHPATGQQPAADQTPVTIEGYEFSFPALGTLVSFKAFHSDKSTVEKAFKLAETHIHKTELILTDYDPTSETRQLSLTAVQQPVRVSEDLWRTIVASDTWYHQTDGAFDASLGTLTRLWRKHRRVHKIPSTDKIAEALESSGWQFVRIDQRARTVEFLREGIRLDFGAIGKGYIVDRAYKILCENDVPCCMVNISGNMRCGAAPPMRAGWRIAIAPLEKGGEPLRRVQIANQAIATSGDLWQYIVIDGSRRSHILDPKTGIGVLGPVSATAIARTATDADALATSACILDDRAALRLAEKSGFELLIARHAQDESVTVTATKGFPIAFDGNE